MDIVKEKQKKWNEHLKAQDIAEKSINFGDIHFCSDVLFWSESRPLEKGRSIIVSYNEEGVFKEETTSEFNVTTGVHGYGGGAFIVRDEYIYFHDGLTNQIFKKNILQNAFEQLTFESDFSYGDFSVDCAHRYLYCLRLNKKESSHFPKCEIMRLNLQTHVQEVLFSGADFYSNVRIHDDNKKILFLQWNAPHMPWDENELWTAEINEQGLIQNSAKIFHEKNVSVYQPEWKNQNIIAPLNKENYSELYEISSTDCKKLFSASADFSRPLWIAGTKTFSFISEDELVANCSEKGIWKTFLVNLSKNTQVEIKNNLTCIYNITSSQNKIAYIGGNETQSLSLFISTVSEKTNLQCLKNSVPNLKLKENFISKPKLLEFMSRENKVYGFYYEPKNILAENEKEKSKPPCVIKIHGGPTSQADDMFNPKIQYYTSRGFAFVELNYSGSSGYGKEYRERLNKNWGLIDVQDTLACAEYLVEKGLAHKEKLILLGGSAGGFTVLNTLTKSDLFLCASCHYGVADLVELSQQIHKFEASYDQNLMGDSIKNNKKLYEDRSPIYSAHKIKTPVIFFHGDKDPVVPMSQSLQMAQALKKQNIEHEMTVFEGEGHGFKKEETIVNLLEKELEFFMRFI